MPRRRSKKNTDTDEWRIGEHHRGTRLTAFLKQKRPDLSGKALKRAIESGACRINGRLERFASRRLKIGDVVTYRGTPAAEAPRRVELRLADILYQDDALLVCSKPAGLLSEPSGRSDQPDLLTSLRQWEGRQGSGRLRLVHRLDRETSGVMVLAQTKPAADQLEAAFAAREVEKRYLAIVDGRIAEPELTIESRLVREKGSRRWRSHPAAGQSARTDVLVTEVFATACLVEARPRTGRTHQIRVHLSESGHPLLGDRLYADTFRCPLPAPRHMLHAQTLSLRHPATGEPVTFEAPLPEDLAQLLDSLREGRDVAD